MGIEFLGYIAVTFILLIFAMRLAYNYFKNKSLKHNEKLAEDYRRAVEKYRSTYPDPPKQRAGVLINDPDVIALRDIKIKKFKEQEKADADLGRFRTASTNYKGFIPNSVPDVLLDSNASLWGHSTPDNSSSYEGAGHGGSFGGGGASGSWGSDDSSSSSYSDSSSDSGGSDSSSD